jgi:hypothetical protein
VGGEMCITSPLSIQIMHVAQTKHNNSGKISLLITLRTLSPTFLNILTPTAVGIAQSVWRRAKGWVARLRFPTVQDFSALHRVQADSGAHPASYPIGT